MLILMELLIHYDIYHQSKKKYLLFILELFVFWTIHVLLQTIYYNSNVSVNVLWAYSFEIRLKSLISTTKIECSVFFKIKINIMPCVIYKYKVIIF